MTLRPIVAFLIYIGSYFPLSFILLVQNINFELVSARLCNPFAHDLYCKIPLKSPIPTILIFAMCALCLLVLFALLSTIKTKRPIRIESAKHIPSEFMNYTLPYVVSFMSIEYQDISKFLGFIVFLIWMFWISYTSGVIILNPILPAFGWRLYEADYLFTDGVTLQTGQFLSREPLVGKMEIKSFQLQDVIIASQLD